MNTCKHIRAINCTSNFTISQLERQFSELEFVNHAKPVFSIINKSDYYFDDLFINLDCSASLLNQELIQKEADVVIYSGNNFPYPLLECFDVLAVVEMAVQTNTNFNQQSAAHMLLNEPNPFHNHLIITALKGRGALKSLFAQIDIRNNFGKVYLVGFGPGDPELLTIKANRLLIEADIILHDNLVSVSHLTLYKAEKVNVGKRKGLHVKEQSEINQMLFNAAVSGKNVVRLKGGDPMIFAHAGEEIEFLQERFIDVEVVPGISSGLAAASALKIPLTHRDFSSSISFISGAKVDAAIPAEGTVVYYMAASGIQNIAARAIKEGKDKNTPVALIHNVSHPDQKTFFATLSQLAVATEQYPTPLVVIMGDVVKLKFEKAKNILVGEFVNGIL